MRKRRLFLMLSLLVAAVTGAWAEETIYALEEGNTFTSAQSVDVKNAANQVVATIVYGEEGGAEFKAARADGHVEGFTAFTEGNGVNGNKPGGTFYTITPKVDCQIDVAVVLNSDKKFYVEEDGTALAEYNGITVDAKYYGTFTFKATANKAYKVYCTGSKLGFYGFKLTTPDTWKAAPLTSFNFNSAYMLVSDGTATDGDITATTGNLVITDAATNVKLTVTPATGTTANSFKNAGAPQLVLNSGTITFEAPEGKELTKIVFDGSWEATNTVDDGTAAAAAAPRRAAQDGYTWTGSAEKVTFTIAGATTLNNITATASSVNYYITGSFVRDEDGNNWNVADMPQMKWNEETKAYEYEVTTTYTWNYFAISDKETIEVEEGADRQETFINSENNYAPGNGWFGISTLGEPIQLYAEAHGYIGLPYAGKYLISMTKDLKLTVKLTEPIAYASLEVNTETGSSSLVFKYDADPKGTIAQIPTEEWQQPQWSWMNTSYWDEANETWVYVYANNTEKVVFDKSFADARPVTTYQWFYGFSNLTTIEGLENLNTSEVTNMQYMFANTNSLKELDLSTFDTQNVTNLSYMFQNASALEKVNLSSFNTEKVYTLRYMFSNARALKELDLSSFNTENVTDMGYMFRSAYALEKVNLSSFNTENVRYMNYMFGNAESLKELDLSNFSAKSLSTAAYMFQNAYALEKVDLSNFNTENVRNMSSMFRFCTALEELDLITFDTRNASMSYFFYGCTNLKKVRVSDLFVGDNGMYMFRNCESLPNFDASYTHGWSTFEDGETAIQKYLNVVKVYKQTVPAGEYISYYIDNAIAAYEKTPEDVKLYTVTGVGEETVNISELKVVGAETPMLIYNGTEEDQTILLITTDEKADAVKPYAGFEGTLEAKEMDGSTDETDFYVLNGQDFVWVKNAGTINANKCWLTIEKDATAPQSAARRSIVVGGETTGISTISTAANDGNYYDINGRRLNGKPAQKGLYILNGKKVVLK